MTDRTMSIPSHLRSLISELGSRMNLPALKLDESGGCALEFNERITVSLQYREPESQLWMYAILGHIPEGRPELYAKLLQANLFWRHTFGATMSLSGDEPPNVVLARPLHLTSLDEHSLSNAVELFLNTATDWQTRLADTEINNVASGGLPLDSAMTLLSIRA